jgi:hypothetical protein
MKNTNGQDAKNLGTQKRTFGYACGDISRRNSLSPEEDFRIYGEIPFNFKRLYIQNGTKFVDGFYKGNDIEELMNNDHYLVHTSKIKDSAYIFNDILFTRIYNVNFETRDITLQVISLDDEDKKEVYYSYFKKVYKDKGIESPYKEFELDETVEKEFLFKYLYESLEFETSDKLKKLKDIILSMQLNKVKSYKEIIFGTLNMDKMIQDFFGFIKNQRTKKSPDIVRDIYVHHIYEYRHYYPYYNYPSTTTPYLGYPYVVSNNSLTVPGTTGIWTTSDTSNTTYTLNSASTISGTNYISTATSSSASLDGMYYTNTDNISTDDSLVESLYEKLEKITENNL